MFQHKPKSGAIGFINRIQVKPRQTMKVVKRIFIGLSLFVLLLLGAAFLLPIFFEDRIQEIAKEQINANLNAEVDFKDIDLSIFRSFPRLSLQIDSFSVTGIDTFDRLPLARGASADFALDVWSVISDPSNIQIKSVNLVDPEVNILVLRNGMANYDVAIATEEEATAEPSEGELNFALDRYTITNGRFVYDDRSADIYLELIGLDHEGSGNFTLEEFELDTESKIDSVTYVQSGVPYISDAVADLDAIFKINTTEGRYELRENDLTLNDLTLKADGYFAMPDEDIEMDLTFQTPESDFRSLWSLIPSAYTQGYESVDVTGQFELTGSVQGTYSAEREVYPSFNVHTAVSEGNVKYPDLPLGINDINTTIDIDSPTDQLDDMTIDIEKLNLRVGNDPFSAALLVRTPISDPTVRGNIDGIIDLAQWVQAFPMDGLEELSGRIVADIAIDAASSALEAEAYDRIKMDGNLTATGINYRQPGLPAVLIQRAVADFTPQNVLIQEFKADLGRSDVSATGAIDNILAYISPEKTMTGSFVVQSNYFDAGEWVPEAETPTRAITPAEMEEASAEVSSDTEIFDRFDFNVDVAANEIAYDTYLLKNSNLSGRVQPNRIRIDDVQTTMGGSSFQGTGTILNAFDYTFEEGVLGGRIDVRSDFVNLDDFMPPAEEGEAVAEATEEELAPIPVPERINLAVNLDADRVQYSNLTLNQVKGVLAVRDEQVVFEEGVANLLGGSVNFAGAYDASDLESPGFSFKYALKNLDFGQSFRTLNTMQALMPIGQFLEGKFSSDLIINGDLGKNMFPVLTSIDAEGFIQTLDAALSGFKPLNTIGEALNVNELKRSVNLNNVKSWFVVEDGTVAVEPFPFSVGDARFVVAGKHGLNRAMDYSIKAAIPREMVESNAVGAAIGRGIDQLFGQANKLGLNLEQGDTLNVDIALSGSISDPKVAFDLLGISGGAGKSAVEEQKDSLVDQAKEQIADTREAIEEEVQSAADSVKQSLADEAKNQLRDALGIAQDTTGTTADSTATGIKSTVEDIKKDLEKFNPFKKKKKKTEPDSTRNQD